MTACIFCRISKGESPARFVLENDDVIAFHDRNPQRSVHVLVVPRGHYTNILELPEDGILMGKLLRAIKEVARSTGITEGFQCVVNCGPRGGQTVPHLHFHVLSGGHESIGRPPNH